MPYKCNLNDTININTTSACKFCLFCTHDSRDIDFCALSSCHFFVLREFRAATPVGCLPGKAPAVALTPGAVQLYGVPHGVPRGVPRGVPF